MEQILNDLINFLKHQSEGFLYLFLFLSAIIENLFPPIPGDTITAFGAFLVGIKKLNFFMVFLVTTIGSVIGFMSLFFIGRLLNKEFFLNKDFKFFPKQSIHAAEQWYSKYGYYIILANRFLPGIRSVISIVTGILKLSIPKVLSLSLVSASIWNIIWIMIGYTLGDNWEIVKQKVAHILQRYNLAAGIILTLAILSIIIFKIHKNHKEKKQNEHHKDHHGKRHKHHDK